MNTKDRIALALSMLSLFMVTANFVSDHWRHRRVNSLRVDTLLDEALAVLGGEEAALTVATGGVVTKSQLNAAESKIRDATRIAPRNARAVRLQGVLHTFLGHFDDARLAFHRAIELDPRSAMTWNNLGNLELQVGSLNDAETAFLKAIELDDDLALPFNNLGVALMRQRRPDEAIDAFRLAISKDSRFASAHANLGTCLLERSPEEAEWHLRKAISLKPDLSTAYIGLAAAMQKQHDNVGCVQAAKVAVAIAREHPRGWYNLGVCLALLEKWNPAIEALREANHLDPDNPHFRETLRRAEEDSRGTAQ